MLPTLFLVKSTTFLAIFLSAKQMLAIFSATKNISSKNVGAEKFASKILVDKILLAFVENIITFVAR